MDCSLLALIILSNKIYGAKMKTFEIAYFKNRDFDAAHDIPFLQVVKAETYDEGKEAFETLGIGFLWSIDELAQSESSFVSKASAEAFMAVMDKHGIGHIEEKGRYDFVAHYYDYQR